MKAKMFEFEIRKRYSDEIRCHLTPDSFFRGESLFTFFGYGKGPLIQSAKYLLEFGIA